MEVTFRGHQNQLKRSPLYCPWSGIFKKVYHVGLNMCYCYNTNPTPLPEIQSIIPTCITYLTSPNTISSYQPSYTIILQLLISKIANPTCNTNLPPLPEHQSNIPIHLPYFCIYLPYLHLASLSTVYTPTIYHL